jgi:hypothetical protein
VVTPCHAWTCPEGFGNLAPCSGSGSYSGVEVRMVSHHVSGTGGDCQCEGSVIPPEKAGMTSVPSLPKLASSAWMTAPAPPQTQPMLLREECRSGLNTEGDQSACQGFDGCWC